MSEKLKNRGSDRSETIQAFSFCVLIAVCVSLCIFFVYEVPADKHLASAKLESRINPNDASAGSLVRLPGIGLSKAQAIIAYREQYRPDGRGSYAFNNSHDLQNVKGIGPKTAEKISEWLKFDQENSINGRMDDK